jgi:hypothetical protein
MVVDRSPSRSTKTETSSPAWSRFDWVALAVVTMGAAALRLPGHARPIGLVIYEIFNARNA